MLQLLVAVFPAAVEDQHTLGSCVVVALEEAEQKSASGRCLRGSLRSGAAFLEAVSYVSPYYAVSPFEVLLPFHVTAAVVPLSPHPSEY